MKDPISITTTVNSDVEKVWDYWSQPEHIKKWNAASDDWHTVKVKNNLKQDGRFVYRMEAKDGSMGFDFGGDYTKIEKHKLIEYKLDDGREVTIEFEDNGDSTKITEKFEPESENPKDMQEQGWQAILTNFKEYVEKSSKGNNEEE